MVYPRFHQPHTWAEYLALEARSDERSEYHDGVIVSMAGASNRHNELVTNLAVYLKPLARTQGCTYYAESVKLFRFRSERYLYPDGMLTCNPLDLQTQSGVRSPLLVIEVSSRHTAQYDFGFKLKQYFAIPSLMHYLVVSQQECLVQHFFRTGPDAWALRLYDAADQSVCFPELDGCLPLAAVYAGIEFGPELSEAEEAALRYGSGAE